MKSLILIPILLLAFTFLSCEQKENEATPLSGEWRLVEVYADPGDGSGSFEPVTSNKTIAFGEDGAYISQGDLCTMSEASDSENTGIFWEEDQNVEPSGCISQAPRSGITYEVVGEELILSYPCIEACQHKYRKQ